MLLLGARYGAAGGTGRLFIEGSAKTHAMRNGQNKRLRGRSNNRKTHNPLTRVYELNGPDVKIRGTPSHVAEKYLQLARDAQSSGDPVAAENYLQHAEHYFRLIASAQEQFRQGTPFGRPEGGMDMRDDMDDGDDDEPSGPGIAGEQPAFGPRDPQPYLPREAQFYPARDQPVPREPQNFGARQVANPPPPPPSNETDVERLPSFITGGAASTPVVASPPPQGYGQNGFESQGDRFPLHRRRRRRRPGEAGEGPAPTGPIPGGD